MGRQKQVTRKVSRKRAKKKKPVGFYKDEEGRTRPITARGRRKAKRPEKVVRRMISREPYKGGRKARLVFTMVDADGEEFSISTDIRWETEKVERLVKTEYRSPKGKLVQKRYVGPKKRLAWIDVDGKEWDKGDIELVQVLPDGTQEPIDPFHATKEIKAEARSKELMGEFLPDSYLELWGDTTEAQRELRKMAWKLLKEGKVAAVRQFAKAKGTKAYVGFIYPATSVTEDGEEVFGLEMMVSENRRVRRRWMPVEDMEVVDDAELEKKKEAKVPELF